MKTRFLGAALGLALMMPTAPTDAAPLLTGTRVTGSISGPVSALLVAGPGYERRVENLSFRGQSRDGAVIGQPHLASFNSGTGGSTNPPPSAGALDSADSPATDAAGWREFNRAGLACVPLNSSAWLNAANVTLVGTLRSLQLARPLGRTVRLATRAEASFSGTAGGAPGSGVPTP